MIFRQFIHDDLGCASYLVGDHRAGVAAVVDPRFDIDEYLVAADRAGVRIERIFETHTHADHVSGHGRLAAATGASIHIHAAAAVEYRHEPFEAAAEWRLGDVEVTALHTPGHRPEHTAFLLVDRRRGSEPWAVLTGDTLFVGDTARPDLAVEKSEGARGIFRSLNDELLRLPGEVEVWPGHVGDSMCGGPDMSLKTVSTIGFETKHNPTLAIADEDAFVTAVLGRLGPQPPNFRTIVELNRGPLLVTEVEPLEMAPRALAMRQSAGGLVIDLRPDLEFDEAHVPGAVSIPVARAGFGTRLAWIAGSEREILFVARDGGEARAAGRLAAAVGVTRLGGFLRRGMAGWLADGRPVQHVERASARELPRLVEAGAQILDVRELSEWQAGHIPGSLHTPWHDLTSFPPGLDRDAKVAVVCGSGQRAGVATGLLQGLGVERVVHVVDGGVGTWSELGGRLASCS